MLNITSFAPVQFEFVCSQMSELPEAAHQFIQPEVMAKLGQSTRTVFAEFATAFPLTISKIEKYWPAFPKILITKLYISKRWSEMVVIEREDLNIFFNSIAYNSELGKRADDWFDQTHIMLPSKMERALSPVR